MTVKRSTGDVTMSGGFACAGATQASSPGLGNTNTGFIIASSGYLALSRALAGVAHFNTNVDGNNVLLLRSGAVVGSIGVTATATSYNTSSDDRLKEDLRSANAAAAAIVENTNVYDFRWKTTGERAYGVIAQEANEVFPFAVTHDEQTDWWGVDYSRSIPVVLQEFSLRLRELEGKLAAKPA
jgi:hypothetical protein